MCLGRGESLLSVIKARAYIFEAVKGGNPSKTIGVIDLTQVGTLVKVGASCSPKTILTTSC